ncbi:mechanosensitive ion channel [Roseburia sp. MUC/MUC-530-WT-4D]|uniref:Mechanosensitive ion channel n=1 Tax=Roseburia porci TaxID=2605790 RepID=A0A6L5YSM9_9FIRM|nr:mechanosensitive ion channel domain-containing protein [Roseburia porci]MCI5516654.1 mechanosensitive ion channel [Roseburia sp.]MDD6742422.1 mechanosensitive ion channel [Roseburia porci]MST75338.1 mechanosensitive ion channel [Roseburia porci]
MYRNTILTVLGTEETAINEITENPGVVVTYFKNILPDLLSFLIQLVIAVVILLVGIKVIGVIVKMLRKTMEKGNTETGVITFLCSLVKYALYFVLCMIILSQFGVTTGSVVAVLGSAGLTVGLALQGSLQNFAGGVLILLLKPFAVGDYIIDNGSGDEGTVSAITIYYTKLLTIDNRMILIPNGSLSNSSITNVTRMEKRRVDIVVGVAYESDLAKVKKVLEQVIASEPAVLTEEAKDVFVSELADSSVNMGIHVWVKTSDYWTAKWRMTENIKNALDENGISIPYPQLDVQVKNS